MKDPFMISSIIFALAFFFILLYNNTLKTDSIIWVHEISHYRNQPPLFRGEVNDTLTELLAFTYEFIYTDYLEQIGYEEEGKKFKIEEYKNLHTFIKKGYYMMSPIWGSHQSIVFL